MGKSKDVYLELCQVEMSREFYEAHQEILKPPDCKLKATYAINTSIKKDERHIELLDAVMEARTALNEYQYLINYKQQIKK